MKTDKNRPASSFMHDKKRAAIPESTHQGEVKMQTANVAESAKGTDTDISDVRWMRYISSFFHFLKHP